MKCFQAAIRLAPTMAAAHNSLGAAWNDQGRRDEAIESYRRAIELDPRYGEPYNNLGVSLQSLGRMAEATACFRKAVELMPDGGAHHSNLLYSLNYDASFGAAQLFAEHRDWGRRYADPLSQCGEPHTNNRNPERRLRVGYVSANFRDQAVNFFSEPILASQDHRQFEIFCYSDVARPDATTERLRGYADQWRPILGETDQRVAEWVRRDQIDILIDLTGHIGDNRLLMFARKPAPVQVTYIGYQNTTGMAAMDYRLSDDYADPPGTTDAWYTERLVRLPRSFFCYMPSADAPEFMPSPSLQNGYITFGSFNSFYKVGPAVLDAWCAILTRVPRSRLVILANVVASLQQRLAEHFAARGIEPDRWELAGRRPRRDYLELIARADVALDPFPFNGHTTTCDALWQGVPTVTLSGDSYVSRFGGSGLAALGLNELIARDVSEYVRIASELAGDTSRLAELRSTLRGRMADSPLLDFVGFTRNLEAAYRQMWTHWCASS
jgi:predicted O-linked N-acetylglucosamine transferase (SPINDLY family)